jgi:hypothetical protein
MKFLYGVRKRTTRPGYREWFDKGSCRWCGKTFGPYEVYWSPGNGYQDQVIQHVALIACIALCIWQPIMILALLGGALIAAAMP